MPCCGRSEEVMRVCRVCELVDSDTKKKLCIYCKICAAYICDKCRNRYDRRVLAAIKNGIKP